MYAVVEAGGRQYQLSSGKFVDVELVSGEPQENFVFERVLAIVDGASTVIGKPVVDGAKVTGKIIGHGRNGKIVVYKYRPKKGTRKRTGHRQGYTRIFIESIELNGKKMSEAKDEKTPSAKPAKAAKEKAAPAKAEPKKAAEAKPAKKAAPKAAAADKPKASKAKKDEKPE